MAIVGRAKYTHACARNFEETQREGSAENHLTRARVYLARPTMTTIIRDNSQSSICKILTYSFLLTYTQCPYTTHTKTRTRELFLSLVNLFHFAKRAELERPIVIAVAGKNVESESGQFLRLLFHTPCNLQPNTG